MEILLIFLKLYHKIAYHKRKASWLIDFGIVPWAVLWKGVIKGPEICFFYDFRRVSLVQVIWSLWFCTKRSHTTKGRLQLIFRFVTWTSQALDIIVTLSITGCSPRFPIVTGAFRITLYASKNLFNFFILLTGSHLEMATIFKTSMWLIRLWWCKYELSTIFLWFFDNFLKVYMMANLR